MNLSNAIAIRLKELLNNKKMTQYQLFIQSGVAQTTISSLINAEYDTVKLNTLCNICQGLQIELSDFFNSALLKLENIID